MFIETWPNLKFDPHGNNPKNDIKNESQKLVDKTCPWIIPNGAPFKAGSVQIKTPDGQLVKTGWKEVLQPTPLIEITGMNIYTFIEIDQSILDAHDELLISYHSVGVRYIPRNTLEEQLEAIEHGSEPIPWSKVIQIPPTLPPEEHWHAAEEMMDWTDLVLYVRYLAAMRQKYQDSQKTITQIFADVKVVLDNVIARYKLITNNLFTHSSAQNNPHGVTATDLFLGNVDNFATATTAEDIAGIRNDVFSTAYGAVQAVGALTPDTSGLMKTGTLPISLLSSSDYIPPVIDGSFEGLGADQNVAAICLENNGRVVIIRRHFDGRNKSLYYTFVTDYKDAAKSKIYFTGFKYSNAKLSQQGYNLDTVMGGSGPGVIIVGDSAKGKWFGALTNGTLNHETHEYTELNLGNIPGLSFDQNYMTHCFKTRDYVILIARDASGASSKRYFYRAPISAFNGSGVVTFTPMNVTFTTPTGIAFSNSAYYVPDVAQTNAAGKFTRFIHDFVPYATAISQQANDPIIAIEDTPNTLIVKFFHRPYGNNSEMSPIMFQYFTYETTYSVNILTGVMTLLNAPPRQTIDFNNLSAANLGGSGFIGSSSGSGMKASVGFTSEGVAIGIWNSSTIMFFPGQFAVRYENGLTPKQYLTKRWTDSGLGSDTSRYQSVKSMGFEGPLQGGIGQTLPSWDQQGELYTAFDRAGQNKRKVYKKVSGGYATRQGVTNINYPMLGRPLTNAVYLANLHGFHQMVGITGTPAELSAAGTEMGAMGSGAILLYWNNGSWYMRNGADSKGLINWRYNNHKFSWPDQMSKTFDEDNLTVDFTPTSYYAIDDAGLAKLKAILDVAGSTSPAVFFSISFPTSAKGNLSRGIAENEGFVYMGWYDAINKQRINFQVTYCRFTFTQDGAARVITDVSVITRSAIGYVNSQGQNMNFSLTTQGNATHHNYFRDGNTLSFRGSTGCIMSVVGGSACDRFDFDFDIPSKIFNNYFGGSTGYGMPGQRVTIPGVGFGIVQQITTTGDAVLVAKSEDNDLYYMLATAYPDSGWIIYFKSGTKLVINGAEYDAPIGTVDLRDIDPNPQNKTFYVYATAYGDEAFFIVSGKKIRHNLSMIPAAEVTTSSTQIITIERFTTFMIGDGIVSSTREAGTIPQSVGLPMDEGTLAYVYRSDLK